MQNELHKLINYTHDSVKW